MDTLFNCIAPSQLKAYNAFMQAIILEGISHHQLTFDKSNKLLSNYNKEIFEHVWEKAISYFDAYATMGIKHVWTMTSMLCSLYVH